MNRLKPDYPCYIYTCPSSIHIEGAGIPPNQPSFQPDLAFYIPFYFMYGFISSTTGEPGYWKKRLWPVIKGSGRRFDAFRYKGPG
jgi:hypothetical protein